MRLIDADALLDSENATGFVIGGRGCGKTLLATCRNYLHVHVTNAPTIDAVPVVRCKDCKHFVQSEPYDPCECMKWTVKWGVAYTSPDGFCSYGERRSE